MGIPPQLRPQTDHFSRSFWIVLIFASSLFLALLAGASLVSSPLDRSPPEVSAARTIAVAMFAYAHDHGGRYPDGASSTEAFQKLVDEKYLTDPSILCLEKAGKVPAASHKLEARNISFDITSGVDASSPDNLPIVFETGYRINYRPNGTAQTLKYYPMFDFSLRTFLFGRPCDEWSLAVAYKDTSACICADSRKRGPVPFILSSDFNSHGKIYRQLTPDGVLK